MTPARVLAARSILREQGFAGAEVDELGPQGEIAAVRVPADQWSLLLEGESESLLAGIRALGFRYVALDMLPLHT